MIIVNETLNMAQIYVKVIFIFAIIVPILFELPTFVQHLMTSNEEILQEVETVDGFKKYFIFVIWLPPVVKQKFIIRIMYGLQCICWWEIRLFALAYMPLYGALFIYTGTLFKLISSIIREMDEVTCRVEKPGNTLHEVPIELFSTNPPKNSDSFQSPMSEKLPLKSNLDIEEPTALSTGRILSSKMHPNVLQESNVNRQSEGTHDLSTLQIKSTIKMTLKVFFGGVY